MRSPRVCAMSNTGGNRCLPPLLLLLVLLPNLDPCTLPSASVQSRKHGDMLPADQVISLASRSLNESEIPGARASLAALRHGMSYLNASVLETVHMPRAMQLVAKSKSLTAQLSRLKIERSNLSDSEEKARLEALRSLCVGNELAAARLQDQVDQLLKAALALVPRHKSSEECGAMCILALRQRVSFFTRQVQDIESRQHQPLSLYGNHDSDSERSDLGKEETLGDPITTAAPWFYKGAGDISKDGHWSGVQGIVKDRWDWFTSKCDSVRGTPRECASAVKAAKTRGLWGKLFHLIQDRSAPSHQNVLSDTLPANGPNTDNAPFTSRGTVLSKAWITMHNFPSDDDQGASAKGLANDGRPSLRSGAGGGGTDDVVITRFSPVYARWQGDCFFEPATVTQINADGTFELSYYSGKLESHASRNNLKPQNTQGDMSPCKASGCQLVLGGGCEGTWPIPTISAAAAAVADVQHSHEKSDEKDSESVSRETEKTNKDEAVALIGGEMRKLGLPDSTVETFSEAAKKQEQNDNDVRRQLEKAAAAISSKDAESLKSGSSDSDKGKEYVLSTSKKKKGLDNMNQEASGEDSDAPTDEIVRGLHSPEETEEETEGLARLLEDRTQLPASQNGAISMESGKHTSSDVKIDKKGDTSASWMLNKSDRPIVSHETSESTNETADSLLLSPCSADADCTPSLRCKSPRGREFVVGNQNPVFSDTVCMEGNPLGSNCAQTSDCIYGAVCTWESICDWPGGLGDRCVPQPEDSCLAPLVCNAERQCSPVSHGEMEQPCIDRPYMAARVTGDFSDIVSTHTPETGECNKGLVCSFGRVCRGDVGTACTKQSQCHTGLTCSNGYTSAAPGNSNPLGDGDDHGMGRPLIDPVTGAHYGGGEKNRLDFIGGDSASGVRSGGNAVRHEARLRGSRPRLRESTAISNESPSVCILGVSSIPAGKDTRQYFANGVHPGMLKIERGVVECCACPVAEVAFLQLAARSAGGSVDGAGGVGNDVLAANENGEWHPSSKADVHNNDATKIGIAAAEHAPARGELEFTNGEAGKKDQLRGNPAMNKDAEASKSTDTKLLEQPSRHGDYDIVHPDCCACPLPGANHT